MPCMLRSIINHQIFTKHRIHIFKLNKHLSNDYEHLRIEDCVISGPAHLLRDVAQSWGSGLDAFLALWNHKTL